MYSTDGNAEFYYSSLQRHMILQKPFWYADLLLKKHLLAYAIHKRMRCKFTIAVIIFHENITLFTSENTFIFAEESKLRINYINKTLKN